MLVTITEYKSLPSDGEDNSLPFGGLPNATQKLTADGSAVALADETRFVRVSTDTKIHLKHGASAADTDPLIHADTVEYFAASEGVVLSVLTAS